MAAAAVPLAIASTIMAAAGTVVSAVQTANTAKANQRIANQQADLAQQQAAVEADKVRKRGLLVLGQQGAAAAASGIDPSSGSAADVADDTTFNVQMDALRTKYNGDLQAWSYRQQAAQFGSQASNAMVAGGIGLGSSLLTGGVKTYNAGLTTGAWSGQKLQWPTIG